MIRREARLVPLALTLIPLAAVVPGCGGCDSTVGGPPIPTVTVVFPNGGEAVRLGSTQAVSWTSEYVTDVCVELSRDGGATWEEIAASVAASAGSCSWTVDDGGLACPQALCIVRVSDAYDAAYCDVSDAAFTIRDPSLLHVDDGAAPGGDGLSWATAFDHPQDALDVAFAGDEVWVAGGTYGPRAAGDPVLITMQEGVLLYGGFGGVETVRDDRDWTANVTTLDGEESVDHVVTGASSSRLDGFTVTGATDGGMYSCMVDDLVVANCTFSDNSGFSGGGMRNDHSVLTVTGCVFTGNTASHEGGGTYNYYCSPEVSDCSFTGNSAYRGGALSSYYSSPTIRDCTFEGNTSSYHGGGVSCQYGSPPEVTRCAFDGNVSGQDGGGMYTYRCSPVITNCVFHANEASSDGGGMYASGGAPVVTNCTFNGNGAESRGGGFCMFGYTDDTPSLTNCVLWGNAGATDPEVCDANAEVLVVSYCDVEGGLAGTGNLDADPLFADAATGDLRLTAGSPCIDAADGTAAMARSPGGDMLLHPRIDDPSTADAGIGLPTYADIGAYEYVPAGTSSIAVVAPDGGEHWPAGSTRIVEWACANVSMIDVELSRDGGTSWESIASSADASTHAYAWTVTDGGAALPQATCRVRITDAAAGGAQDTSDADFTIGNGILRVDAGAPVGGDGLSWATAFQHPQDAVDAASPGNEIWVAAGTHLRRSPTDTVLLAMADEVAVYGGFAGTESDRNERDPAAHVTTLDGEGVAFHVVTGASNAVLDGFTVTGGNANGTTTDARRGAGFRAEYVTGLSVSGCVFSANQSDYNGAGVYCTNSFLALSSCSFTGNASSYGDGGGICASQCSMDVSKSAFTDNTSCDDGGGIRASGSLVLANCTFRCNGARVGAGVRASGTHVIASCTFFANAAKRGGAVAAFGTGSVTNCIFWRNTAPTGPAVLLGEASSCPVTYCCVEGGFEGTGNVDGDPTFVDAPGGDLRLVSGSACIDAANGNAAPVADADGNLRHDDTGLPNVGVGAPPYADIGAYEFQGTTAGSWIDVLAPRSGSSWVIGRDVLICWTGTPDVTDVKIELSRDDGATWETLVASTPNDRIHGWTVDDGGRALPQSNCVVRISNAAGGVPVGVSDGFAIHAGIWHVDIDAPAGGDGLTWATALRHPQDAIDAASPGDEVWVASGTYVRRDSGDTTVFTMGASVAAYGGFDGSELARGDRDWAANVTTLDGELVASHVVEGATDVALDGFTVRRGYAHGATSDERVGAGMSVYDAADVVVANCIFSANDAQSYGGGIAVYDTDASLSVSGSQFVGNTSLYGGGIYADMATLAISDCTLDGNTAGRGGGLYANDVTEVTATVFSSNTAGYYGGGALLYGGGAGASVIVDDCVFDGNAADWQGGGMMLYANRWSIGTQTPVSRCTFSSNTAQVGGGIYVSGRPAITNCVLRDNAASQHGGGVYLDDSAWLANCTMSGNTAAYSGGGIYGSTFARPDVTNCILRGVDVVNLSSTFGTSVTYSVVEGGFTGTGNLDADPLFADEAAGDFHLTAGSPCIDAGDGAAAPLEDADGSLRVDEPSVVDTGTGHYTYADIGAYEFVAAGAQGLIATSPSGGEDIPIGSDLAITWESSNVADVHVELSRDGGTSWGTILPSVAAAAGSCTWTATGPASLDCVLRLSDAADGVPACVTTGLFAIGKMIELTAPVGGETWVVGSTQTIRWRSANLQDVVVELSRDNGTTWETVVPSTGAASGQYSWVVTDGGLPLAQRECLVRVSELGGPAVTDVSAAAFAIWDGIAWRVDVDAPAGGDGLDWAGAMRHPQDAAEAAESNDEIWVAEGTYVRRDAGDTVVLAMVNGADLYGGFAATEDQRDLRNPVAHPTVLDGEDACYHVVTGTSSGRLDGFTLTRGNANGSYPDNTGAGMRNDSCGGLVVANCVFTQNIAADRGGAVFNYYANSHGWPQFVDCAFTDNTAAKGAGAWNRYGGPLISRCSFTNNTATTFGGGIGNLMSDPNITDCVFDSNAAPLGAGVYVDDHAPKLTSSVFIGNAATIGGGALYNCGECDPVVTNCTFSLNSAPTGGAVYNDLAYPVITNCILWGNTAGTSPEIHDTANIESVVRHSCVAGGFAGERNIAVDPGFANPPAGDLRLAVGSPCIDAAEGSVAPALDADGNARRDDTGMPDIGSGVPAFADIGAYEFQGTSSGALVTIVYPDAGSALGVGHQAEIRWAATTDIAAVDVELSRDGGGTWETLGDDASNTGVFLWTLTDGGLALPQSNCLARVSDSASPTTQDTTEAFTIFSGVWFVKSTAPAGGDGLSWATAFRHPQDAMDVASPGHEIWVCEGTYGLRTAGDMSLLTMHDAIGLYGGFDGSETSRADRDWTVHDSSFSGGGGVPNLVIGASGTRVNGLSFTAGIFTAQNHRVINYYGTSLFAKGVSDMVVANCVFDEGLVTGSAVGIYTKSTQLTVTDCVFTKLARTGVNVASGCDVALSGCTFTDNDAAGLAVAVSICSATACDFIDNRSRAVRISYESEVDLHDCLFQANTSDEGGAVWIENSSIQLIGCRFFGNTASLRGGAIHTSGTTGSFQNCLFWGNAAAYGGAIYGSIGNPPHAIANCTFASNTATVEGGALQYAYSAIVNCIFHGNAAPSADVIGVGGIPGPDMTYSCVQGGYAGAGNIALDPLFVNAAAGDFRLAASSPCIDAADGDAAPATDANGATRVDDPATPDTGTGTPPYADMGAYEYVP